MKHYFFKKLKRNEILLASILLVLALLVPACARQPQPARVEEITFQSGEFTLVGDLQLPAGTRPFPVVIFLHGSEESDRTNGMYFLPIMERMLRAGYATFAWDTPGVGESTGNLSEPNLRHKRAQILLDAIELMKTRPDIDPTRIGVWGGSQAGYVIPIALTQTKEIAFVICVSCPGESGRDQMGYQAMAFGLCQDMPKEKLAERDRLLKELDQNRLYETYAGYLAYRRSIADLAALVPVSLNNSPVTSEETWQANPIENESVWNPVPVFSQAKIPVLAIFGDQDRQMDPIQGAHAYREALENAGNPRYRVELFHAADHGIITSETGCPADESQLEADSQRYEQYVRSLGYESLSEAAAVIQEDPYSPESLEILRIYPYAPGYLDLIEEWLRYL